MSERLIQVMIVDDHDLVRMGIKRLLRDVKDIKVIAESNTGEDAIIEARKHSPDVVLLDVKMPGIGGLETTRRLLRINPDIKIIAVTSCSNPPYPRTILHAGAVGFLPKECHYQELIEAIRTVFTGQRYIHQDIAQQLALESIGDQKTEETPNLVLSERELQIMVMITSGMKVQEIADQLFLSTKTVNSYRYRIFEKLNLKSDVELTHYAIRHNLIDLHSDPHEE